MMHQTPHLKVERSKGEAPAFVAYYRVSTKKQGRSGLGLEAQRECVEAHLKATGGVLIAEYTEQESGANDYRWELSKALKATNEAGAVLIVAKLDRLSRSAAFLHTLHDSGAAFFACDRPNLNTLTLGIFASFAQTEREEISERTRAALEAKRAKVGEWRVSNLDQHARELGAEVLKVRAYLNEDTRRAAAYLVELERGGKLTLQAAADKLNAAGFKTPKGCEFSRVQVSRLRKLAAQYADEHERLAAARERMNEYSNAVQK